MTMNDIIVKQEDIQQITKSTNAISHWSIELLKSWGVGDMWIKYINMLFLLIIATILVFILQYVTRKILRLVFGHISKMPKMKFFERLMHRRFPHFLAMIIPFSLVKGSIPIIFEEFPKTMHLADKLTDIYLIFYVIWLLMSVINAFGDTLKKKPGLSDKPIESYIQVVKIFLYFIGFIILFSILSGKNPMYFITGLGAASAILLLIFKDTILGFVASIQVSANDMVRIGDWITMPKYGADGDVIQITLSTVKIRNFDKTIVTIPPYSLVSESFQNWRGMQESGGRRFKRDFFVNQSDVYFLSAQELEEMKKVEGLKEYIEGRQPRLDKLNNGLGVDMSVPVNGYRITNCDLFIQYAVWMLKNHPRINKDMTLMVRTLAPTTEGLPVELYTFTDTTVWAEYEGILAEIVSHILASMSFFKLRVYSATASDASDVYIRNAVKIKGGTSPS